MSDKKMTVEQALADLNKLADMLFHSGHTDHANNAAAIHKTLTAALAGKDVESLACGHHKSLAIISAETGKFLYCDLCDTRHARNDAENCEYELRERLRTIESGLYINGCQLVEKAECVATGDITGPWVRNIRAEKAESALADLKAEREAAVKSEELRERLESLLTRLRPDIECAPWVCDELRSITNSLPAPGEAVDCKFPRMKIALFDEFGLGADDRVMDYGRECFEAGQSSYATAPPQVADAMVERLAKWMAEHDGVEDIHDLVWQGSPPEPWGEEWQRYLSDAEAALKAAHAARGG